MKHIAFRLLFGLVLLSAIAGIAWISFNTGVTRGADRNNPAPADQNSGLPSPVYALPYWRPVPFFGFGCFLPLALLFLLFLAFGAARRMLWGPRYGWHWMRGGHGPWGHGPWGRGRWGDMGSGEGVPPVLAEMHRRMHAAENEKTADPGPQK